MSPKQSIFTSESVTSGHPDKVCDRIADSIVDALLEQDPEARSAVEVMATTGQVHLAGEITTSGYVDLPTLVRETINEIGYTSSDIGFDGDSCGVLVSIDRQSPDIAQGVQDSWETREGSAVDAFDQQGAGDQGMMFGYACNETPDLMPAPIWLAHRLAKQLEKVRRERVLDYLCPDGKTQVTVRYEDGRPVGIDTIVLSTQHLASVSLKDLREEVKSAVIDPVIAQVPWIGDRDFRTLVNPAGRFILGGPAADTGVTGRKLIVDTYGGMARHGGGAFSGKDASKVDRSAAYAARWVAKNVVAAGLVDRAELQVAYAIGSAHPVSVELETFGTEKADKTQILQAVRETFDLRPAAIIDRLSLRRPIYSRTAAYGHFGRSGFTWEDTDMARELRAKLGA